MAKVSNSEWLDDDTVVDFQSHAEDKQLEALAADASAPQYNAEDFEIDGQPGESLQDYLKRATPPEEPPVAASEPEAEKPAAEAAQAPEPEKPAAKPAAKVYAEPETLDLGDGVTAVIQETKKGWHALLDIGVQGAGQENFYGATKEEMYQNILHAKAHATRKIREQERRRLLEAPVEPSTPTPLPAPNVRDLTADEMFEIKTQLDSNPDLALSNWFQKKTGLSLQQLVGMTQKGVTAAGELESEAVAREFMGARPDFYATPYNRDTITGRLSRIYLGKTMNPANADEVFNELVAKGHWTVAKLSDTYDELSAGGFLETAQEQVAPEPEPEPALPVKAAPPENERIVRTVRRPRAGLGLRSSETTAVRPPAPEKPPTDEDFEKLDDKQLGELFAATIRHARSSRR